jgi:hypothetical protein
MSGTQHVDARVVNIVIEEFGDHAVFRPSMTEFKKQVELERLPDLLSKSLSAWTLDRPDLRVRTAVGIVEDGFTAALHIWFDRVR